MNIHFNRISTVFAIIFLFGLIKMAILFYLPILYVDLGFDPIHIGFIVSIGFIVNLLFAGPAGVLCDRKDIRKIILIPLIFYLLFFFGMLTTSDFIPVLILVFLLSTANNISKQSMENVILKIKEKSKNKLIGMFMFFSSLGVMAGMLFGGFILSETNFINLFLIMGIITLILIPLIFLLPKIKTSQTKLKSYVLDLRNKKIFVIGLVVFLFALHFGAEHISYSLFLKNNLNLDFFQMGIYMATSILFMSFAGLFGGRIITKSNTIYIFAISLIVSGLGHILMTNPDVYISLVFRIIHEVGDALQFVAFLVLLKDHFPGQRIGGNTGIFVIITTLGAMIGSFLFSSIGFEYGHQWSLIISGILTILAGIIVFSASGILNKSK